MLHLQMDDCKIMLEAIYQMRDKCIDTEKPKSMGNYLHIGRKELASTRYPSPGIIEIQNGCLAQITTGLASVRVSAVFYLVFWKNSLKCFRLQTNFLVYVNIGFLVLENFVSVFEVNCSGMPFLQFVMACFCRRTVF